MVETRVRTILVAAAAAASLTVGTEAGQLFGSYAFPVQGTALAPADLNGDGAIDLAVTSEPDALIVLLNQGDGTFAAQPPNAVGQSPGSVAVGDFDGINGPDLAVGNSTSGTVSTLLNNGDGSFAPAVQHAVGVSAAAVASGHLDGDGFADVAVVDNFNGTVSVLISGGDGSFAGGGIYPVPPFPSSIAAGDLDGDTDVDLVVGGGLGTVSVLLNVGNGTFAAAVPVQAAPFVHRLDVAQLDGDASLDLVVVNPVAPSIVVLLNNGDGTFGKPAAYPAGDSPRALAISDLDADGDRDLAVGNIASLEMAVLLNDGSGAFVQSGCYPVNQAVAMAAADFDGDGSVDVATTAGSYCGGVFVLLNGGDATFGADARFEAGPFPCGVAVGDVNGDGFLDTAVSSCGVSGLLSIFLNDGQGTFSLSVTYPSSSGALLVDVDNDGNLDLAIRGASMLVVRLNQGDGTFGPPVGYGAPPQLKHMVAADFNGDGFADLAVVHGFNPSSVTIFINDGAGAFPVPTPVPGSFGGPGSFDILGVDDLDGDGDSDLALTANSGVWLLFNPGSPGFMATLVPIGGGLIYSLALGDVDGDGDVDIATIDILMRVLHNDGTGSFPEADTYVVDCNLRAVLLGDLDRDGDLDLIVAGGHEGDCPVAGNGGVVTVFLNQGDGTLGDVVSYASYGCDGRGPALGDADGDGDSDLFVANLDSDSFSLLRNRTPFLGDLDGDGAVGILDFLMLLAAWGPCPGSCPPSCTADLDGDCSVGIIDFLMLLAHWTG